MMNSVETKKRRRDALYFLLRFGKICFTNGKSSDSLCFVSTSTVLRQPYLSTRDTPRPLPVKVSTVDLLFPSFDVMLLILLLSIIIIDT